MKKDIKFFKPYNKYGLEGFYIPVRNSFSNILERELISNKAKEKYEKEFGQTVLTDQEFIDWYSEYAKSNMRVIL